MSHHSVRSAGFQGCDVCAFREAGENFGDYIVYYVFENFLASGLDRETRAGWTTDENFTGPNVVGVRFCATVGFGMGHA